MCMGAYKLRLDGVPILFFTCRPWTYTTTKMMAILILKCWELNDILKTSETDLFQCL